jgi:hypothetical protein
MSGYGVRSEVNPLEFGNGCRGKKPYTSKKQADGAMRVLARSLAPLVASKLNTYKCSACRHWHVGKRGGRAA